MKRRGRKIRWAAGLTLVILAVLVTTGVARHSMADWRTASRASAGIAPDPAVVQEAIVQVYTARAYSWRGMFGVHSWFAVKPTGASKFTVYEIIGWRLYHTHDDTVPGTALTISHRPADGRWFGNIPTIIADIRGDGVDDIIRRIDIAARNYPYNGEYKVWPGPNSNTFTAHVARAVPELKLDLPPTAIGKDYIPDGVFASTPSGTGYQFSLFGLFGVLAGKEEGVEVNLLGLTFGLDFAEPAVKLPLAGRVGFQGS